MAEMDHEMDRMSSHSLADFLEPLDGSGHEVDDLLDELAKNISDNASGQDFGSALYGSGRCESNLSIDLDPNTLEEMACSLQESLAKFDDFLERANASNDFREFDDELTELKPIETFREKRSRDLNVNMSSGGMSPRIRSISGEQLSSVPSPMNRGFATTSSLHNKNSAPNAAQKNETWDMPEPVLGEVTGHKMRRLLSEKSYFQSRPPPANDASKNAPWNQPKAAPMTDARTAMHSLLNSSNGTTQMLSNATQTAGVTSSFGWPSQPQQHPNSSLNNATLSQMQRLANAAPNFAFQTATVTPQHVGTHAASSSAQQQQQSFASGFLSQAAAAATGFMPHNSNQRQTQEHATSWTGQAKPGFVTISLQDMQRVAGTGVTFPPQTTQSTTQASYSQNAVPNATTPSSQVPTFASISVQDMQRLAASGFAMQGQTANAGQNAPMLPPKPAFASVSLQDMQRLASTGVAFPTAQTVQPNATSGTPNSAQAPPPPWASTQKPTFASITLEDMQRLASTGATFAPQTSAPTSSSSGVSVPPWAVSSSTPATGMSTMQNMRLAASAAASSNTFGSGAQSFGNIQQATASVSKPAFTTVSLEDMQRLAGTGVTPHNAAQLRAQAQNQNQNEPWTTAPKPAATAQVGGIQKPTFASVPAKVQPDNAVASQTASSAKPMPKPTFASVTIDDMQRLVAAYGSHSSQSPPTVAEASGIQHPSTQDVVNTTSSSIPRDETQKSLTHSQDDNVHMSTSISESEHVVICIDDDSESTPPQRVSGGALQRMMSEASYFQSIEPSSSGSANAAWPEQVSSKHATSDVHSSGSVTPSDKEEANRLPSDSDAMLKRLRELMNKSTSTQQALQEFDKKRGLPRSHSQTMVNSSRSRRQIIQGKIIAKWDGSPLISDEHELGKPKPRVPKKKNTTEETIF
jgi:hypothetical protein